MTKKLGVNEDLSSGCRRAFWNPRDKLIKVSLCVVCLGGVLSSLAYFPDKFDFLFLLPSIKCTLPSCKELDAVHMWWAAKRKLSMNTPFSRERRQQQLEKWLCSPQKRMENFSELPDSVSSFSIVLGGFLFNSFFINGVSEVIWLFCLKPATGQWNAFQTGLLAL